ncbi:MAG: DUF4115 domain-containing protein [Gammaproteobacteria bacterium]|nr:DUF4115 domain-containing protein [Gammaproteobacteria bacterium]
MVDEKAKVEQETELEPRQGSGRLLAAARKQQNKTVAEIAEELNLSITQIKTIELDQTDGLPEPTYVRGYIRSYAKLLGLNPEEVLKNYLNPNWQQGTSLDDIPRGIGNADELSDSHTITPGRVAIVAVVISLLGYLWYSGMLAQLIGGKSATEQAVVQNETDSDGAQISELETDNADNFDGSAVVQEHNLSLQFSQTSWVDIRDADDTKLAYRTFAEGETLQVSSAGPINVFIGNAAGVNVQYNGEDFDISEHREGVYAKFSIGEL